VFLERPPRCWRLDLRSLARCAHGTRAVSVLNAELSLAAQFLLVCTLDGRVSCKFGAIDADKSQSVRTPELVCSSFSVVRENRWEEVSWFLDGLRHPATKQGTSIKPLAKLGTRSSALFPV